MIPVTQDPIDVRVDSELEELIPIFMQRRREDVETLRGALAVGDMESISRIGHSMKGTGGGYGFPEVSILGARLEIAGRDGDGDEVAVIVEALEDYLERVRVVLV